MPSNYMVLQDFCKDNKLKLITDAAQALGAKYKKRFISNFTDITTTSFFHLNPLDAMETVDVYSQTQSQLLQNLNH